MLVDYIPFMVEAYRQAAKSPDPSNQNGAVLIDASGEQLNADCNRFPDGVQYTSERMENRDLKLAFIEHAERSTIVGAKTITHGKILVCPWYACEECARCIAFAGIKEVIGHKPRMDTTPDRWMASVERGDQILDEAGVRRVYLHDTLSLGFSIIVNGQEWTN